METLRCLGTLTGALYARVESVPGRCIDWMHPAKVVLARIYLRVCFGVETTRSESEGWVLGEGLATPPHQLGIRGSAVSSPSGVRDETLADIDFSPVKAIS